MPKFKLREFISARPWLNNLVIQTIISVYNHGIVFFDSSYRRVRIVAPKAGPYVLETGNAAVYALYHQNVIGVLGMHPRRRLTILISDSRDGHQIATACTNLGFSVARGSAGRGGVRAGLEMVEAAKAGQRLAFAVDGPRGPACEVKIGVVRLAQMCGVPIVPVALASRGAWYMKSWDRFNASSWSTPMVTIYGDPINVPESASDEDLERVRQEVDESMRKLTHSAQTLLQAS
jgi:lysophospholipid acyltransferase (LPLAT)-like uncharacterized protein